MDFKKRNVRFFWLMTAFIILFSISMCGCIRIINTQCTCKGSSTPEPGYGTCQVWGYVFDDQDGDHTYDAGEGISGHLSKIYNQSYTFTDPDGRGANGKYIVFAPTPATYTLLASASGYGTATRSITLSSSQMSKREDFELQPLP